MKTAAQRIEEAAVLRKAMQAKAEHQDWLTPVEEVELDDAESEAEQVEERKEETVLDNPDDVTLETTELDEPADADSPDSPIEDVPVVGQDTTERESSEPTEDADEDIRAVEEDEFEVAVDEQSPLDPVEDTSIETVEIDDPTVNESLTVDETDEPQTRELEDTELVDEPAEELEPVGVDFDGEVKPLPELDSLDESIESPDVETAEADEVGDTSIETSELEQVDQPAHVVQEETAFNEPVDPTSPSTDEPDSPPMDEPISQSEDEPDEPLRGLLSEPDQQGVDSFEVDDVPDRELVDIDSPVGVEPDVEVGELDEPTTRPTRVGGLDEAGNSWIPGYHGMTELPAITLYQANQQDLSDPAAEYDERASQQMEWQMKANDDFVSQLVDQLGPKLDALREIQAQNTLDFFDQHILIQQFLIDPGD